MQWPLGEVLPAVIPDATRSCSTWEGPSPLSRLPSSRKPRCLLLTAKLGQEIQSLRRHESFHLPSWLSACKSKAGQLEQPAGLGRAGGRTSATGAFCLHAFSSTWKGQTGLSGRMRREGKRSRAELTLHASHLSGAFKPFAPRLQEPAPSSCFYSM